MNELAAAVILFCATALPMAAQTSVLVAKSRMLSSVTFDDVRNFALPTACDEQGRSSHARARHPQKARER